MLGKKYKMPMDRSLEIVQKLYESGYLTYPRTNSEYLATAEKDKVKNILTKAAALGYNVKFRDDKAIFDDSKIESHSAITPTYIIPDRSRLSEEEMKVYSTVMRRFAAVFCAEPCLADKTEITVKVGELEEFTLKGTIITQKGWMKYDDGQVNDKLLPPLEKGDEVNICFKPAEKESTPPKHYTIETLNNYLKNPFREEKARAEDNRDQGDEDNEGYGSDDREEYRMILEGLELGTEATRTGIIDNAIKSKYIELKKDVYTILPDGEFLIEMLAAMSISMDKHKTSELGRVLKKIFHGEIRVSDGIEATKKAIDEVFGEKQKAAPEVVTEIGAVGDDVGVCPLCGSVFSRTKFGYGCRGYVNGCRLSLRHIICGRVISKENVSLLLKNGRTSVIKGFRSKKGTYFDAALKIEGDRVVFDFDRPQIPKNDDSRPIMIQYG